MLRRYLSAGLWIAGGQAATAVGVVVGVRVLTEYLTPDTFGRLSLAIGLVSLALNILCTPLGQACTYLYPSLSKDSATSELDAALWATARRYSGWLAGLVLVSGFLYVPWFDGSLWMVVLLWLLFVGDFWRTYSITMLNAAQNHRSYATWLALDAWGKPLAASLLVIFLDASILTVIGAYVAVSLLLAITFSRSRIVALYSRATDAGVPSSATTALMTRIRTYSLPLLPLGVIGWVNGVGDRYIIGNLLSVADAGLYAAAAGLASRPLLLLSGAVEQALRPIYQQAVSSNARVKSQRILAVWLTTLVSVNLATVAAISYWHTEIAALLLGPSFRSSSALMPWIAAGYALLTTSYIFERVCYAHGRTIRVLAIQGCTGVAAVVAALIGTIHWGLIGAAVAVPVYYSVQLLMAMAQAFRTDRQHQQTEYARAL